MILSFDCKWNKHFRDFVLVNTTMCLQLLISAVLQEVYKCYVVYLKDSQLPHFHAQLAIQAAHL